MKISRLLNWLMIGLILCSAVAMAHLSGMSSIKDNFYKTKNVLDCSENYYKNNTEIKDGYWKIDTDQFVNYMYFGKNAIKWNYFCMNIDELNKSSIVAYLNYYNSENDMELLYTQEIKLTSGNNIISTECKKFDFIGVFIFDEQGTVLHVDSVQLRQSKPIANLTNRFLKRFICLFLAYVCISILLYPVIRKVPFIKVLDWIIEKLLCIFSFVNIKLYPIVGKFSDRTKKIIRIAIFVFILVYFNLTSVHLFFNTSSANRTLILSILLFIIAISLSTGHNKKQNWKIPLVRWWLVYNLCTILSDLVVKKRLMHQGIVLLFVFGFLIYCWNNQNTITELLHELFFAIHVYFGIMVVCCFLFRPDIYIRYQGTFSNPVTFGAYVSIISVVAFAEIMDNVKHEYFSKKILFFILEFLVAMSFVWKTQARSALLPVLFILILVFVKYLVHRGDYHRNFICMMTILVVMSLPVYLSVDYIIKTVPIKLNTTVTLEDDGYQPDDQSVLKSNGQSTSLLFTKRVYAASAELEKADNIRIFDKFSANSLETLTSGRTLFWKGYLRRMNLFGHYDYANVMGKKQHAHCSLFMIAYRYGVFTVIPYIFMLCYAFAEAFRYMMQDVTHKLRYVEYPFFIICVFLSISLLDVAEYLFSGFGWMLFNITIGVLFCKKSIGNYSEPNLEKPTDFLNVANLRK